MDRARTFGVSTHLYHGVRLTRAHLLEIAAAGFETVEVRATRSHIDYHNTAGIADLQQWLAEAGLTLRSVHAPLGDTFSSGRWSAPLSIAAVDRDARERAVAETERALLVARRIAFKVFVVHLGVPRGAANAAAENSRDGARRSLEALQKVAEPLGVQLALEVVPNELSRAGSLVHFVERMAETADLGICLDFGHAYMDGDLVDAIETVSEHLVAVDVHDNRGRTDDHFVPFEGTIDWAAALTAVQKVGYDQPLMLEIGGRGPARETLARARQARQKMERLLAL